MWPENKLRDLFGNYTKIETKKNGKNINGLIYYKGLDLGKLCVDNEGNQYCKIGDMKVYSSAQEQQITSFNTSS